MLGKLYIFFSQKPFILEKSKDDSFRGASDLEVSRRNSGLTSSNSRLKLKFHGHYLANLVPKNATLGLS